MSIERDLNAAINIRKFALIGSGVPADRRELTPVDRSVSIMVLLFREETGEARWKKQETSSFQGGCHIVL